MLSNLFHMYGLDTEWKERQLMREVASKRRTSKEQANKLSLTDFKHKLEVDTENKMAESGKNA